MDPNEASSRPVRQDGGAGVRAERERAKFGPVNPVSRSRMYEERAPTTCPTDTGSGCLLRGVPVERLGDALVEVVLRPPAEDLGRATRIERTSIELAGA
jgi:hypothetical protein